ncbi:hypothetical protein BFP72_11765 [Reichenbachiella sp. 5M10]|nr:hypothetical protein BFP72_11765 [Reichenbachiella sp. 5M10]
MNEKTTFFNPLLKRVDGEYCIETEFTLGGQHFSKPKYLGEGGFGYFKIPNLIGKRVKVLCHDDEKVEILSILP